MHLVLDRRLITKNPPIPFLATTSSAELMPEGRQLIVREPRNLASITLSGHHIAYEVHGQRQTVDYDETTLSLPCPATTSPAELMHEGKRLTLKKPRCQSFVWPSQSLQSWCYERTLACDPDRTRVLKSKHDRRSTRQRGLSCLSELLRGRIRSRFLAVWRRIARLLFVDAGPERRST